MAKNIRILENKLDKAMIKFNEAMSIKKTYDIILHKLNEERHAYDKQLSSLETQVKSKTVELDQMLLLSHDANHTKNQSESDLKKHQTKINAMRQERMQEIHNQK